MFKPIFSIYAYVNAAGHLSKSLRELHNFVGNTTEVLCNTFEEISNILEFSQDSPKKNN
jgi:hypothetical protein